MPLYTVSTQAPIANDKREELANLIMNVHCGITGAPETFVNVMFVQNVPLEEGVALNVVAGVRKGRTPKMNDTLSAEMIKSIAELMNLAEFQVELAMFETPAQWIMEGGEILPEPGEEALCEWLQKGHSDTKEKKIRAA